MEYIECPKAWDPLLGQPGLFLAGGIVGCPDWQTEMVKLLSGTNYAVLNPRRAQFPIHDSSAAYAQIKWEFDHLRKANVISFWFCAEKLQPIVMYELGAWSMAGKPLFVGVDPDYARLQDVQIQTNLVRPDVTIVYSLADLARAVSDYEAVLINSKRR
ncbi:MAG: hypothetical protein KJ077_10575 [Anaerolineae bacterium]|nr:hypothetical protein [Anaerolineae bacterium]